MPVFDFPDSPSTNQTYTANGVSWQWTGTVWKKLTELGSKGGKGVKGDKGQKGVKGEKGDKGQKGINGTNAGKGQKGEKGVKGEKGQKGIDGTNAGKGDKGVQGDKAGMVYETSGYTPSPSSGKFSHFAQSENGGTGTTGMVGSVSVVTKLYFNKTSKDGANVLDYLLKSDDSSSNIHSFIEIKSNTNGD